MMFCLGSPYRFEFVFVLRPGQMTTTNMIALLSVGVIRLCLFAYLGSFVGKPSPNRLEPALFSFLLVFVDLGKHAFDFCIATILFAI